MADNKAYFNGTQIGDYIANVHIDYNVNRQTYSFVRANGTYISNIGGGLERITFEAFKSFDTIENKDQYIQNLITSLGNASNTLTINGVDYSNCFLLSIIPSEVGCKWLKISLTFIRNPF